MNYSKDYRWEDIPPQDEVAYSEAMAEQRALMKVWVARWLSRRASALQAA